ncbi:MAG: ferredoxin [Actinophytocola sp.]|uniref:ferredoxin n=1 Tax=Actinophytocola sp. TaxID=1872138 RepID=UPI0013266A44|nr:ferredoxin [Actinophytocola sp.]MPZ81109.1 ferredoxin [Actinophytocola sp.]
MAGYRIEVDRELCCGAGLCADALPTVFDQDGDGVVVLRDPTPAPNLLPDVEDAEFACPATAIKLHKPEDPAA